MSTSDARQAFDAGDATWKTAKAAATTRMDLSGQELQITPTTDPWDFSGCLLAGSRIKPASGKVLRLNIAGADLTRATIAPGSEVELTVDKDTWLTEAVLEDLTLANTKLAAVSLTSTSFFRSTLKNVTFGGALDGVGFNRSTLNDVGFADCSLIECTFMSAMASDCVFDNATFAAQRGLRPSSLQKALFSRCSFVDAKLSGASLESTRFIDSDLRRTTGMVVDNTVRRDTVLAPGATDDWSILRRHYTGAHMVFNLIAMVIFFVPFIFEAMYWTGVNRLQLDLLGGLATAEAVLAQDPNEQRRVAVLKAIQVASPSFKQCMHSGLGDKVRSNPSCLPVWQILLGVHLGWWAVFVGSTLLVYNALRLVLTWFVGPLRDEENRSYHSPARKSYGWMIYPHRLFSVLFYFAITMAVVHLAIRLATPVWIG